MNRRAKRNWPTPLLARTETGMYNCPQTGVALAALEKIIARGEINPKDRVVVISTAHGLKFTEFKVNYHKKEIPGLDSRFANTPIELPEDINAVQDVIEKKLGALSVT